MEELVAVKDEFE
jgi:Inositol polyphosphate kinase